MSEPASDASRGLSNHELAAAITELAGHLNAATRRWLALIAEFDRRKGWSDSVTKSCARWLNWQCGMALGVAREKVRVAHALAELPLIGAAMGGGELSYSRVRELIRVATPATEEYLLSIALQGTASHVEQLVRQYRRVQEVESLSREERQQQRRSVSHYFDAEDGSLVLKARLPTESGMLLLKALEAGRTELPLPSEDCEPRLDVPAGTPGTFQRSRAPKFPPTAHRADALAGAWRFVNARGESWVSSAPGCTQPVAADWTDLATRHEAEGIRVEPHTAKTHWRGESIHYGHAIDVLLAKERGATSRGAARAV